MFFRTACWTPAPVLPELEPVPVPALEALVLLVVCPSLEEPVGKLVVYSSLVERPVRKPVVLPNLEERPVRKVVCPSLEQRAAPLPVRRMMGDFRIRKVLVVLPVVH